MNRYCLKHCLIFLILIISNNSFATSFTCPAVQSIKDRTISKEFDWTVSEETSLESVLNVSELLSVTIENHGQFLRCTYNSSDVEVNMDAKPITVDCLIVPSSQNWINHDNGRSVCNDVVKGRCEIETSCQIIQDGS